MLPTPQRIDELIVIIAGDGDEKKAKALIELLNALKDESGNEDVYALCSRALTQTFTFTNEFANALNSYLASSLNASDNPLNFNAIGVNDNRVVG